MKLKPRLSPQRRENIARLAVAHLRDARDCLLRAGCANTVAKVRAALRSADGALRNRHRFACKTK